MIGSRSVLPRPRPRTNGVARPQLTSLVDMMVILLVFLLKSFSVEGQLVTPSADLHLPESSSERLVEPALSLEITTGGLLLDGLWVADLPAANADSLIVAPLHAALRNLAPTGADSTASRALSIQCDRGVDFAVLKRVLFTCDQAAYDDLSLLVLREDS